MWQLILGLLQHLGATPAIVVERNMFAYYKLPLRLLDMEVTHSDKSVSGLYYVLQCPPKLDDNIPKPRDMQVCRVVDKYKDIWRKKQKSKKNLWKAPSRMMLSPLPPPAVKRMQWGWRQRRPKRQNQESKSTFDEATPLQHLRHPHRRQKLLKLSADHQKFKRGNSSKGYQHMYYRDESYNDHIFYDELKLDGTFKNRGKSKTYLVDK
ncbi:uncharacterized protein LOC117576906 [Drosophila albomicans]|uniref:Uncharacterized protein LOC117576906 n=1 Tax=Drosophila albomicans TaxID=7291 RepID=A0A6P8XX86_DROAB|nr:uncharacterized protein LOC117576906 [Drosophila albomicans]